EVWSFVDRKKYHFGSATSVPDSGCRFESVHNGHGYVDHQHVRIETENAINSLLSILGCADNIELLTELPADSRDHSCVIIGQQYSNSGHNNSSKYWSTHFAYRT